MMNRALNSTRPDELVAEFFSEYRATGDYPRECVARLAALATGDDLNIAQAATTALFTGLIERLADSFSPADAALYNRVFAQVIEHSRHLDKGHALDAALNAQGLCDEAALIGRARSLGAKRTIESSRLTGVRRVIVLSRVTLGADVAITSVIIRRFEHEFPNAEIVLIGGRKAEQLFGGDHRIRFEAVDYHRAGLTLERLLNWPAVAEAVRALTSGLAPDEWLVVDPDSRLTQLGLLPLTDRKENYFFFPSREYGATTRDALGQLAAAWLDEIFDAPRPVLPSLSLHPRDTEAAGRLAERLRQRGARLIIAVNFGVGGNSAKRVNDEFEQSLVAQLVREGATVILDKGAGADETRRADTVVERVRRETATDAIALSESRFAEALNQSPDARLLVWDGSIGRLAALIAQSDLYIGYDSAGQHIAAAVATPGVTIFAGYSSPRMLDRWRPTGSGASSVIAVDPSRAVDTDELLSAALAAVEDARGRRQEAGGSQGDGEPL
jgi:ADP-heptose:LPS heptosyltransferase